MAPLVFIAPKLAPFVISFGLVFFGYNQLNSYKKLNNWVSVQGSLLQTKVGMYSVSESQYGAPTKYYYPMAHYSYNYEGSSYDNNEYAFDTESVSSTEKKKIENILAGLSDQESIEVYLDPANPKESAINISISNKRKSHGYSLCVASLLIFLVGVYLIGIS